MEFKQIYLPNDSVIYFIDGKRTSEENFEYKNVLCNIKNMQTSCYSTGLTKKGNRFYQCYKN